MVSFKMIDTGKKIRMDILSRDFNRLAVPLLEAHAWNYDIEKSVDDGEYLVIKIEKCSTIKRFALLYSQSTKKEVYLIIEKECDACLINGLSLVSDCSFSKDFKKPLTTLGNLLELLKDWNCEVNQIDEQEANKTNTIIPQIIFTNAENPSEQCWMIIKSLNSKEICKRFLANKKSECNEEFVTSKAEGVSFLIQNACDYFDIAQRQNLTQRMLNLYYGVLSFMEADILANSSQYNDLKAVENITKQGHGLGTFLPNDNYEIDNLYTFVLKTGLFSTWLDNFGYDTTNFLTSKVKKIEQLNELCYTFNSILQRIPELAMHMRIADRNYSAGFFIPSYDNQANSTSYLNTTEGYKSDNKGTYVVLYDESCTTTLEDAKKILGPTEQHSISNHNEYEKDGLNANAYSIFVRHDTDKKEQKSFWSVINTHKSNYSKTSVLIPLPFLKDDWIVYAIMVLYTFSIIVRYYPNLWRRMQYGELDNYYAVCIQFAMIIEKVLPQIFYERITGQKLKIATARYA